MSHPHPTAVTTTGSAAAAVRCMLEARTVAVVGASAREGSFGAHLLAEIRAGDPAVRVVPVNPRYREVSGLACVPTIADVDGPVDLVMLGVPSSALEEQLAAAAAAGARSAVVYASGYETPEPGVPSLVERLAAVARDSGMAVCGGNGMGFWNLDAGVRALGYQENDVPPRGPVTFLSHSGSAFSAMLRNQRGIGFNLVVSAGQEYVTTLADYMQYALDQPTTGVGVAREMVTAHSGALAGEDGAYEALFDAYGVLRVDDLDEMCDTVQLLASGRRAASGGGVATVHDSGAERALAVDVAEAVRLPYAQLAPSTLARLGELIDPGLQPSNPLDAWGTGRDTRALFADSLRALCDDAEVAAVALCVDLVREFDGEDAYLDAAFEAAAATTKPVVLLSNAHSSVFAPSAQRLRAGGVPVLEGTRSGMLALRHLLELRDYRARPAVVPAALDVARAQQWRGRLASGPLGAADALQLLADYGVAVARTRSAGSPDEAVAAADRLGYPVVLKTDEPSVAHKSDAGGVVLGLDGPDAVAAAYADVAARLGPRVSVSATAPAGVEIALGVVNDPQMGPLVLVAAGGVLVELLHDRALAVPPLDRGRAEALLGRLRVRPLLDGVRGAPAADVGSVVDALVALSSLAVELGGHLAALDVNPLVCGPGGAVAVDALVVPL